jgi:phosphatidylglycerol lysyltransferase
MAMDPLAHQVLHLLARHGWNATSFQTMEQGFSHHFVGDDACVAYVDSGHAWVAAGAPIATEERFDEVAAAFVAAARAHGRRALFFGTESRFALRPQFRALLIGEQPVWDPADWEATLATTSRIREQVGRARRKGVTVRTVAVTEIADPAAPLRRAVEGLIQRWLAAHPLPPMGFLVDVQPFSFPEARRYFVAEQGGQVVGFLAAVPIYARAGWLFEDVLRSPEAPNGTVELLIDGAMRALHAAGSRFVTLGLAPLAGPVGGWLGLARRWSAPLYDFAGLYAFRDKLRPGHWDPIYVTVPRRRPVQPARGIDRVRAAVADTVTDAVAIIDVLSAFARGHLLAFGLQTLLRGPALVVRVLGLLLLPWMLLLALAPARYFPAASLRWAWIAFDLLLAGALVSLAARWRRPLAVALALAVTADAVVTAGEVSLYNLAVAGQTHRWWDWLGLGLAVAAPSLAAVILWNAIGHRQRAA